MTTVKVKVRPSTAYCR